MSKPKILTLEKNIKTQFFITGLFVPFCQVFSFNGKISSHLRWAVNAVKNDQKGIFLIPNSVYKMIEKTRDKKGIRNDACLYLNITKVFYDGSPLKTHYLVEIVDSASISPFRFRWDLPKIVSGFSKIVNL